MARAAILIIASLLVANVSSISIGNCSLDVPPTSWLVTSGVGIQDYADAGIALGGNNYCIDGNRTAEILKVAYHIDLPSDVRMNVQPRPSPYEVMADNPNNGCSVKDPRIHYCFPLCDTPTEVKVIESALASGQTWVVADLVEKATQRPGWAITVMAVDYNNPATHLNASVFLNPEVWCSVYIGIKPILGFSYLYEIQLGKVIQ